MAPRARVADHPGSSQEDIESEPDWGLGRNHRIGFLNNDDRRPGLVHGADEQDDEEEAELVAEQNEDVERLRSRRQHGELINFRDVMENKADFHLKHPNDHPPGWRFILDITEDWVKQTEDWPANEKAWQKKQAQERQQQGQGQREFEPQAQGQEPANAGSSDQQQGAKHETGGNPQKGLEHEHHWGEPGQEQDDEESRWKRDQGDQSKRHGAYGASSSDDNEGYHSGERSGDDEPKHKTAYEQLREKYSPEEITLLRMLQHERNYIADLGQNDGQGKSPIADMPDLTDIDVADQFGPDNWIPRSGNLIRNTGKHPLNAESRLSDLAVNTALITPNEKHYVRNHGAVPRLYWETHKLDIEDGKLVLSMDDLERNFNPINIAVALACDGNRRGEVNLVRKSKGFSWGAGAVSCAYWKGVLLRDLLLAAGVEASLSPKQRRWVNLEGSEDLTDGKYATCIPLEYAIDPSNDVIVAYEMNDVKLPPDHGFPCRIIIPGYVGGRSVKWLARIWTSDKENDSHYHVWDNRVLPAFVTEKDGDFANTLFNHPSTACNEQNLNSIITKPAQDEKFPFSQIGEQQTYRIEGIAYDGGGHEVQRVELSLDGGETWLYCIRTFPDRPIRHGNKFWTWVKWHIDVDVGHFIEAKSLSVRAFNVFKNTQPRDLNWNAMGMMNNGWYVVKPSISATASKPGSEAALIFKHPFDPENNRGWMKPSTEVQLQAAKSDTGVPDKQFTRQEVEKHNTNRDCWIVVNGKVFDATSVLSWHPGGASSILGYAGRLTSETTSSFESVHDEYATKKLNECVIGRLTDKAQQFVRKSAEQAAAEAANSAKSSQQDVVLQKQRWTPVKLFKRKSLSQDTRSYTFRLPEGKTRLGVDTCQHILFGIHMKDKMLIRSYTPTRPVVPNEEDGTFELVVKVYLPTDEQPGGAFSNFIDCMPLGESVDVRGPTGEIRYLTHGKFEIEGKETHFDRVSLILGGSGITPGYQLLERILRTEGDRTEIRVVDANKSEADILLKVELEKAINEHAGQIAITHVLSHPSADWKGLKGHVNAEIIKSHCFEPSEGSAVFLCGPPTMIQKAALPALKGMYLSTLTSRQIS